MIGGDYDECLLELTDLLQMSHDGAQRIIELQEIAQCTVSVEHVHLLVDELNRIH